ncbi:MAG: restriction endonuclease [Archangium gephyra]|uniref:Restriction endonuclease n=1 Tax=Archangium gephyra TaxID=48 RepID=A0A2W5UGH1_9BACT|nr:MAG: restriction endonuclease [Archangium gephyra]
MSNSGVEDWLLEAAGSERVWFVKRLSANDTGATGSHQVGMYLPKQAVRVLFPGLLEEKSANPKRDCFVKFGSHASEADTAVTFYNQRTRNEVHMTRWGGKSSPIQDPDQMGALLVLSFPQHVGAPREAMAWLARTPEEEDTLEAICGDVLPGDGRLYFLSGEHVVAPGRSSCWLSPAEIKPEWKKEFPSTETLMRLAIERRPQATTMKVDRRLMERRACEEQIFFSVEEACVLPSLKNGFTSIDAFIRSALSVTNRRKSRAGKSLELHVRQILQEEQVKFTHNAITEGQKRPDFIFPTIDDYLNPRFPAEKLRMLAVKTTCKDRWRQVINEANRLAQHKKHLLTLQEGVSVTQFSEMRDENIQLVVPASLLKKFPPKIRPELMVFGDFIREVRSLVRGA